MTQALHLPPRLAYVYLLLPTALTFFSFPLARIVFAGTAFVWVALLLFQLARGAGILRALFMASFGLVMWTLLCVLITDLADPLFGWAGERFRNEAGVISGVIMIAGAAYAAIAASVASLLCITAWRGALALFLGIVIIGGGAVVSGSIDNPWLLSLSVALSSLLVVWPTWRRT